ncbi:MAG: hypothetical protein E7342_03520 [Clostridiales bacterium]|nr:hypothetical protein [Clostridiales bacterium]
MNKIKHYFSASNTKDGFINFFDNIIDPRFSGFTYVLKGGAGTGKSTFMKKVGEYFFNKGLNIEYFHCSFDKESLDGVRLKDYNIAIVDGTNPHVVEVGAVGLNGKILNVGEFVSDKIILNKNEIEKQLKKKKNYYGIANQYIKCAGVLYDLNNKELQYSVNEKEVLFKAEQLIANLRLKGLDYGVKRGLNRKLFSNILSLEENPFEKMNAYKEVVYIEGNKTQNQKVLEVLLQNLLELGVDVTVFCDNLDSNLIESLYLDSIDVLIKEKVYLQPASEKRKISEQNQKQIFAFIKKANFYLGKARKAHQEIEKFYIKNMNFDGLNLLEEKIIGEIEEKIKKT